MDTGHSPDIFSLLGWGKNYLKKAGIEDYEISAEVLLGNLLGLKRSELFLSPKAEIDPAKKIEYENLIEERAKRVPLQYLTGHVEFYNIKLKCDQRALIPRPETEILTETVIEKMSGYKSPKILDVGTGSGNIAVALAANIKDSFLVGVDISGDALNLASENADLNMVQNRVKLIKGDIFNKQFVRSLDMYDCVVSNPPYVSENEKKDLQPEVIEYEPNIALFSEGDPLRFFRSIISIAPTILKAGGFLAFEVGMVQSNDVIDIMSDRFIEVTVAKDLAGTDRIVTGILGE